MTIVEFTELKKKRRLSLLTAYDYWTALILNETPIDAILVGDSGAMVMHGYANTLPADVEMMTVMTEAVVKGAPDKLVVGDLPFLSYRKTLNENMLSAEKIMKAGAHAVKLEGATGNLELVKHLVQSGVPVMGHLGLTPQSVHQLGGFKVQGRTERAQDLIYKEAQELQESGCFSVVLECVPEKLGERITQKLEIPVIGIGAGAQTDGQILVLQDMLGLQNKKLPRFVKKYLQGCELFKGAINSYVEDVQGGKFPSAEETYQ